MNAKATGNLYLLAGGASRRFGSDKALARVDGRPMASSIIEALTSCGHDRTTTEGVAVTLVTGESGRYAALGYPVITDRPAGVGPIGGLCAALHHRLAHRGPGWLVLASCDLVRPRAGWLLPLTQHTGAPGAQAVAFFGHRWEPMLALYHTNLISTVRQRINAGAYAMHGLLDAAEATRVALPDGLSSLPQANTPGELEIHLKPRGVA